MHSMTEKSLEYAIKKAISEVFKPRSPKSVKRKGPTGPQRLTELPKAGQELVEREVRLNILFILTKI